MHRLVRKIQFTDGAYMTKCFCFTKTKKNRFELSADRRLKYWEYFAVHFENQFINKINKTLWGRIAALFLMNLWFRPFFLLFVLQSARDYIMHCMKCAFFKQVISWHSSHRFIIIPSYEITYNNFHQICIFSRGKKADPMLQRKMCNGMFAFYKK